MNLMSLASRLLGQDFIKMSLQQLPS